MLNEMIEYRQYTDAPETVNRLNAAELAKSVTGIERAMITVARGLIRTSLDGELLNEKCVVHGLRLWCGLRRKKECYGIAKTEHGFCWTYLSQKNFENLKEKKGITVRVLRNDEILCLPEEFHLEVCDGFHLTDTDGELWEALMAQPEMLRCRSCRNGSSDDTETYRKIEPLDQWIIRYTEQKEQRKRQSADGKNKWSESLKKELSVRRQSYDQPLFDSEYREEEADQRNTMKKITYEGIIAKALLLGSFSRRYLVAENLPASDTLPVRLEQASGCYTDGCSRTELDVLCKMTAAYLIAGGNREGKWVVVKMADVSNWGKSEMKDESGRPGRLSRYFCPKTEEIPEDVPLFERRRFGNNTSKMKINAEWMKLCGWRLASEEELDAILKEHPDCLWFRDDGGRAAMTRGKRYEKSGGRKEVGG